MRSDLGRLAALAEILQVGRLLAFRLRHLASRSARWYIAGKMQEHPMKVFRLAAVFALLAGPAYAQMPSMNLIPELSSKTPEEKAAEAERDKAYRESLKKIPDPKASSDPWGTVRSGDTPKASAPAKRTKTGSSAN
jgi:hypothetical protein